MFERLIRLKYYFVLKRKNTFTLGFNAAKNTYQIKKALNKNCFDLTRIFSNAEPQSESNFPFLYIIRLQTHIDLWNTLAPLRGEIDICALALFRMKFSSEQLNCGSSEKFRKYKKGSDNHFTPLIINGTFFLLDGFNSARKS